MKCPYLKETMTTHDGTQEFYAECYEYECPFYEPEKKVGNAFIQASCGRAIAEKRRSKNETDHL